jgi:hypothetical protein
VLFLERLHILSYSSAGLDVCEQFMDFNGVIKDEDLIAQKNASV